MLSGQDETYRILGIPVIKKRLNGLSSAQLSEWQMYNRLDPIGEWRQDFHFADLQALIINTVRTLYAKKGSVVKLVSAKDLMIEWGSTKKPEPKKQNFYQMKAMFEQMSKISGNPIKTKK